MKTMSGAAVITCALYAAVVPAHAQPEVLTYHNDTLRTGWNQNENILFPSNVQINPGNAICSQQTCFGLLTTQAGLDEQVDAEPLYVPGLTIGGQTHDVVYVATENNSIYAIDGTSGAILLSTNLGAPVPQQNLPGNCFNNSDVVGINSTPVIDLSSQTLYVITYNWTAGAAAYNIHALDLTTLSEKSFSPKAVSGSFPTRLPNGKTGEEFFQAAAQRQRPALLEANGNIYAGFGSFCDFDAAVSRGWIFGWNASLAPLSRGTVTNSQILTDLQDCTWTGNHPCFLSSIWMSGYGLATDNRGNIFFATGNTAPGDYSAHNLAESVVRYSSNSIADYFTPSTENQLDSEDGDLGSGGVLVLPVQVGQTPDLAIAAGKDGNMYLLNRDNLGKLQTPSTAPPATNVGPPYSLAMPGFPGASPACWCGESYFQGPDGVGRVVSSAGVNQNGTNVANNLAIWQLQTSFSAAPTLTLQTQFPQFGSGNDPGFFTSVSSLSTFAGSAIVWAVLRPIQCNPGGSPPNVVTLTAVDPIAGQTLFGPSPAGTWPACGGNPNIVPMVANGKVYVASYKQLAIFGLGASGTASISNPSGYNPQLNAREVHGTIVRIDGPLIGVRLRSGKTVEVDIGQAVRNHRAAHPVNGQTIRVLGVLDEKKRVIRAQRTFRLTGPASSWPADR